MKTKENWLKIIYIYILGTSDDCTNMDCKKYCEYRILDDLKLVFVV